MPKATPLPTPLPPNSTKKGEKPSKAAAAAANGSTPKSKAEKLSANGGALLGKSSAGKAKKASKGAKKDISRAAEAPLPPPVPPKEPLRQGTLVKYKGDPDGSGKYERVIVEGFFTMSEDISPFCGWVAQPEEGEEPSKEDLRGVLEGSFGKAGKCKVLFKDGTSLPVGSKFTLHEPA
uniref:Uncharacterized protein n=1 Tax=Octactis speculum TaxID=3111310 RepID=A0A7S2GEB0_9STRA